MECIKCGKTLGVYSRVGGGVGCAYCDQKELEAGRLAVIEKVVGITIDKVIEIIEQEPEYPTPMTDGQCARFQKMIDEHGLKIFLQKLLQSSVIETKRNLIEKMKKQEEWR